jgi:hypothetical protein
VLAWKVAGKTRDEADSLVGILHQHLDDVLHGHGIVVRMPAVEVGDHGHARVAKLCLAGELGLGQIGHADHRIAEILVGEALGERGELRALDANIGPVANDPNAFGARSFRKMDAQARADRMGHGYMCDAALAEERIGAVIGTVDELVDQHEGARRQLLLE